MSPPVRLLARKSIVSSSKVHPPLTPLDRSFPVPVASGGGSFSFKCGADAGAFLMFSPKGYSMDIESKRHVVNYMRANFAHWVDFADKYGLGLKEEELMFVCGTTKTSRWAVAAFHGQYKKKQGMVTADFSSAAGLNLSVSISNQSLPQSYYGDGPRRRPRPSASPAIVSASETSDQSHPEEPADQCIFIHYYKMKRRLWGSLKMIAGAGPDELPSPDPDNSFEPVAADDDSESDEDEPGRRKVWVLG